MFKKIIILDFESDIVNIFNYDKNKYDDFQSFIDDLNETEGYEFNENMCQWMIVDELKIYIN